MLHRTNTEGFVEEATNLHFEIWRGGEPRRSLTGL